MNLFGRLLLLFLRWRKREPLGLWDTAVTPFRVVPSDLDVLGHMNNGKYLSLMDLGRMDLMLRSGFWAKVREQGWYPVVAGQTITYRKSLNLGQAFELSTAVLGFDDRWVFMEQTFTSGDVVYAHAVVRARFLKQSGGSVDHDELAELAGGYPDLQLPDWLHGWTESTKIPASAR
ncbi:acyl-CoA thioesterase [Propioniciclava sp.]|uniref:acyl-CoA thioesterase n=1 Tax=Propioniciclava sp. TaxID=2038686 RepID=UPI002632F2B1|nr:acyl-CoA thioesterase [Propioniciclava sp.]